MGNLFVCVTLLTLFWRCKDKPFFPINLKLSAVEFRFPCPLFCLSLELQTEQAVFACLLSPSSDWLTSLSPVSLWRIDDLSGKHSWKSRCYVCSHRRAATYLQLVTTGCFWTVSYTVLMFVQVLAGQSANVGVTSRVTEVLHEISSHLFTSVLCLR